jgi:hypothetical protein
MSEPRDLRDLIGDDVEPDELARLERAHALLVEAGPPPELPPAIAHAPEPPSARVIPLPRRYRYTTLAAAAIVAVALFGLGYLAGGGPGEQPVETLAMHGPGDASADLALFSKDEAGNWPMELTVTGLAPGTYELWLTHGDELAASCGSFAVAGGETTVPLNAPFKLREFDGWVVVPAGSETPVLTT